MKKKKKMNREWTALVSEHNNQTETESSKRTNFITNQRALCRITRFQKIILFGLFNLFLLSHPLSLTGPA